MMALGAMANQQSMSGGMGMGGMGMGGMGMGGGMSGMGGVLDDDGRHGTGWRQGRPGIWQPGLWQPGNDRGYPQMQAGAPQLAMGVASIRRSTRRPI